MNTLDPRLCLDRARDRRRTVRAPRGVRRRLVGRLRGYRVWVVDGERVRNELHCDFTCGGSDARYAYCGKNEIWIDDALGPLDATATLLHEYVECERMKRLGEDYEAAHDVAASEEAAFRELLAREKPTRLSVRRVDEALG